MAGSKRNKTHLLCIDVLVFFTTELIHFLHLTIQKPRSYFRFSFDSCVPTCVVSVVSHVPTTLESTEEGGVRILSLIQRPSWLNSTTKRRQPAWQRKQKCTQVIYKIDLSLARPFVWSIFRLYLLRWSDNFFILFADFRLCLHYHNYISSVNG